MARAYRIVEWQRRYEVTNKGRAADENTPMTNLRKSSLDYVRSKVYGHSIGPAFHTIIDRAYIPGQINEFAVFGLFCKLAELAADQRREYRGWILDKDQQPMGAVEICKLFHIQEIKLIQHALDLLCHREVGWLEMAEFPDISGTSRICPEKPGDLYKETEREGNLNETKASDCSRNVSDSADAVKEARCAALKQVLTHLRIRPDNPSDITTFRDIFDQIEDRILRGELTTEIFDRVVDEAKDADSYRFKKIARFVNAMKREPFCYIPEHRVVPGSKYR